MAKGKNITHHCPHCDRDAKMEMVGAVEDQPNKTWYRCTRCRHALLIDQSLLQQELELSRKKLDRATCAEYRPDKTYTVGDAIFHSELDDIGKIISKERTSGGGRAIVVSFERSGERRLLESVRFETSEGAPENSNN
jgi:uncharacterized Zn finger protein